MLDIIPCSERQTGREGLHRERSAGNFGRRQFRSNQRKNLRWISLRVCRSGEPTLYPSVYERPSSAVIPWLARSISPPYALLSSFTFMLSIHSTPVPSRPLISHSPLELLPNILHSDSVRWSYQEQPEETEH